MSLIEFGMRHGLFDWGATIAAITSTIFLLRKSALFWVIGPIANLLWLILFFVQQHYLAAGLQLSYIIFAGYALLRWRLQARGRELPAVLEHAGTVLTLGIFALAVMSTRFTSTDRYLEFAAVSLFIVANWLTSRKSIACWYFWIAANSTFALFLWHHQIWGTFAAQFAFIGISLWGIRRWKAEQQATEIGASAQGG